MVSLLRENTWVRLVHHRNHICSLKWEKYILKQAWRQCGMNFATNYTWVWTVTIVYLLRDHGQFPYSLSFSICTADWMRSLRYKIPNTSYTLTYVTKPPLIFCLTNIIQRQVLIVTNLSLCRYRNTFSYHNCYSDNSKKSFCNLITQTYTCVYIHTYT